MGSLLSLGRRYHGMNSQMRSCFQTIRILGRTRTSQRMISRPQRWSRYLSTLQKLSTASSDLTWPSEIPHHMIDSSTPSSQTLHFKSRTIYNMSAQSLALSTTSSRSVLGRPYPDGASTSSTERPIKQNSNKASMKRETQR